MNTRSEGYTDHQHMRNLTYLTIGVVFWVIVVLAVDKVVIKVKTFRECLVTQSVILCIAKLDGTE